MSKVFVAIGSVLKRWGRSLREWLMQGTGRGEALLCLGSYSQAHTAFDDGKGAAMLLKASDVKQTLSDAVLSPDRRRRQAGTTTQLQKHHPESKIPTICH